MPAAAGAVSATARRYRSEIRPRRTGWGCRRRRAGRSVTPPPDFPERGVSGRPGAAAGGGRSGWSPRRIAGSAAPRAPRAAALPGHAGRSAVRLHPRPRARRRTGPRGGVRQGARAHAPGVKKTGPAAWFGRRAPGPGRFPAAAQGHGHGHGHGHGIPRRPGRRKTPPRRAALTGQVRKDRKLRAAA